MSRFADALSFALRWEGGFVDDPDDRGGATNRGITQATYDAYRKSIGQKPRSVKALTEDELQVIYQTRYWDPAHCGAFEWPLAVVHFDLAVNGGVGRAAKMLQAALGVKQDGVIGSATLGAAENSNQKLIALKYLDLREAWYRRIGVGNQRKFLAGWLNRTEALRQFVKAGPKE